MSSEYCVSRSALYGNSLSRDIEQRVDHVEATDPSVGNTRQTLPGTANLPRYRGRGVAVPAVVARDADRAREVGRDECGVQTNRQGFIAEPAFAELGNRTGMIGIGQSRKFTGMFNGGDGLVGTLPVVRDFDGSLGAEVGAITDLKV